MATTRNVKISVLVLLFAGASGSVRAATVSGNVYYERAAGLTPAPSSTSVKLCSSPGGISPPGFNATCAYATTNGSSSYSTSIPPGTYYVFMWNDRDYWGSDSAPSYVTPGHSARCTVGTGGAVCDIAGQPRPLESAAAQPVDGEQYTPFYPLILKWRVPTDVDRSAHPITFDIWGQGAGGPDLLQLPNVPCNADPQGFCQARIPYPIPGNTRYYWHIVTKLFTGNYSGADSPWDYFSTDSASPAKPKFSFVTVVDPNATYAFRCQIDGSYLSAQNGSSCGGGAMTHGAQGVGQCETFILLDDNGGELDSGDVIHLGSGGFWASAELGGGDPMSYVNVNRSWIQSWETFTIEKPGGGRIVGGDTVFLRSVNGYYMTAEPDASVTCNRPAAGLWEQFWLEVH